MDLAQILHDELEKRKKRKSRYSLRIFARDLEVNRTTLSFVINKKRNLSKALTQKVIEKLRLSPVVAEELLQSPKNKGPEYKVIELETFELISSWYHQAIICLASLKTNRADPDWIATRLNIPVDKAAAALDRLVTLGLIQIKGTKLILTEIDISTPTDIPSSVLRNYHKENLALISNSLDNDSLDRRDMTSITFPLNAKDLPKMKEKIKRFQRNLCKTFEHKNGNEVYTLATHLFPLTQRQKP